MEETPNLPHLEWTNSLRVSEMIIWNRKNTCDSSLEALGKYMNRVKLESERTTFRVAVIRCSVVPTSIQTTVS
jgi:hypothetical protein